MSDFKTKMHQIRFRGGRREGNEREGMEEGRGKVTEGMGDGTGHGMGRGREGKGGEGLQLPKLQFLVPPLSEWV